MIASDNSSGLFDCPSYRPSGGARGGFRLTDLDTLARLPAQHTPERG